MMRVLLLLSVLLLSTAGCAAHTTTTITIRHKPDPVTSVDVSVSSQY